MNTNAPLNVLIVGSGMYACGIGTEGYGTILPAVFEGYRQGLVSKITMISQNPQKRDLVLQTAAKLNETMGLDAPIDYYPKGTDVNPKAYEALLKTGDYNCAILSFPDHLHFEVARNIIKSGLHCLVVKPLVTNLRELRELIELQRENNVYCAVEYHKRFDETNLRIRRMLADKSIGDLLYVLVQYSQRKSVPLKHFRAWAAESNIFQYLGVHYVDLIYFSTRALPQRVLALGQKTFLCKEGLDTYDAIQVLIEWREKDSTQTFTSSILTNWIDPHITTAMSDQKIKYIGSLGRIECDQKERGLKLVSDSRGIEDVNPYFSDFQYDISDSNMNFRGYGYKSIIQFLEDSAAVVTGSQHIDRLKGLRATFEESRIPTAVIEAATKSLENGGQWVHVDANALML